MEILNNVEPYYLLMAKGLAGKRMSFFAFKIPLFSAMSIGGCIFARQVPVNSRCTSAIVDERLFQG